MNAGFSRVAITPPPGTPMLGWADRDRFGGCDSVHDDLFLRAASFSDGGREVLVVGLDLCLLGAEAAARLKAAIRRETGVPPDRILLNTSHTHAGPATGTWGFAGYAPPDEPYARLVEAAAARGASAARADARKATLRCGLGRTSLPLSRRRKGPDGTVLFRPDPAGTVDNALPVCLVEDAAGDPIVLLFAVSCHPSIVTGRAVSAEYPGAAATILDARLGTPASLFLQGAGGDAKPSAAADAAAGTWRRDASWGEVDRAGRTVAAEVLATIDAGLRETEPDLRSALLTMALPLAPPPSRTSLEALAADQGADELRRLWAAGQLRSLSRDGRLPASAPIAVQGIRLGEGLRIVAMEGEPVAALALLIRRFCGDGVTFALGYSNGQGLYIPSSAMTAEGGYEVSSYYEYGFPAPVAPGVEDALSAVLGTLRSAGAV